MTAYTRFFKENFTAFRENSREGPSSSFLRLKSACG